jgi:hypothetical protein
VLDIQRGGGEYGRKKWWRRRFGEDKGADGFASWVLDFF